MPYNFATDSFHTKKLLADFLQAKCDFRGKTAIFCFLAPFGGLRGDVRWSSWRGKHVVDFLLVLIELFSLGVMTEALRANIGSKSAISLQQASVDPKFQVEGVVPH